MSVTYPCVDGAGEAAGDTSNVLLDDGGELSRVSDGLNPGRVLRVPQKSVAPDQQVVLFSKVDNLLCSTEVELSAIRLSRIPLHAIHRIMSAADDNVED